MAKKKVTQSKPNSGKQQKTYFGFLNDHSGSMNRISDAAKDDFNSIIETIKNTADSEKQDAVVSVFDFGYAGVTKTICTSNPHVLSPISNWQASGGTPMNKAIVDMVNHFMSLDDVKDQRDNVSVLVMLTTDGEDTDGNVYAEAKQAIKDALSFGNFTFTMRVPKNTNVKVLANRYGIPVENIQPWETTAEGLYQASGATAQAVQSYMTQRTSGLRGSNTFFSGTAQVNTKALKPVNPKDFSLYVVPTQDNGKMISDFILSKRMKYLKGAAFYQLTKTESRITPDKLILIRDRKSGQVFEGVEARTMIGLPTHQNARLHPGDHGNYDVFIQSQSWNRKLAENTGIIYYEKHGKEFTLDEINLFTKPAEPKKVVKPGPVELPAVNNTSGKPVKSPIPVTPRYAYFETRDDARAYCRNEGISQTLIINDKQAPKSKRWSVPTKTK